MQVYFSKSSPGFYVQGIHSLPADAVAITDVEHATLLRAQAQGKRIIGGSDGRPEAVDPTAPAPAAPTEDQGRAECSQRITAVASIDAQLNLERYLRRLSKKPSPSTEEAADLANGEALDGWITAMRAKWRALVAAGDVAFRDDAKWPACPAGAAALATRF